MEIPVTFWAALAAIGFVLGLWLTPTAVLRIGLGLSLLAGAALVLANTGGWEPAAYWLAVGMVALGVVFAVGLIGAVVGRLVRRAMHGAPEPRREREYNSIID